MARGSVFVDANGNGQREAGERGLAGVSVSNGCEVVASDADGRYAIGLAPLQFLFVSQPSGYRVPVDADNLPRFYYRHYPDGTPTMIEGREVQWRFPVSAPTGPLPASVDFPLTPAPRAREGFTAHAFADPQARSGLDQDKLREDLVNTLIGNPFGVAFGLTVGDVVYDNLDLYERHKSMMALMDIPQWYLPGNHDLNFESPDSGLANETYKHHFGPTYYSFNVGNVHFVALNNVEYAGADARARGERAYRGHVGDDQLYWLGQDLARVPRDRLIVLASHIPLIAEAADDHGSAPISGPGTDNFSALLELLAPFEHVHAMAGHDTSNSWKVEVGHEHGWRGQPWIAHTLAEVRGNGWRTGPKDARGVNDAMMQDGNPNGFYVLHFDDVEVVPEFIPFPYGPDAGSRMRIMLDPPLAGPPDGGSLNRGEPAPHARVVVNLFDGGKRDSVWMSVDGAEPRPMRYTIRTDPLAERLHRRLLDTDQATGAPTASAHIFQLPLPDGLSSGVHRVEVYSEDEFGQRRHATSSFEILP